MGKRFAISLLACGVVMGQSTSSSQGHVVTPGALPNPRVPVLFQNPATQARFANLSAYMGFPSPLKGGDETLAAYGDSAAFFISVFTGHNPPLSAPQTLTALDIIHKSFARLNAVQSGDRKPEATLALLKIFQATAVDQTVKERIAIETNFLNTLPATIESTPIGVPGQPRPAGPAGLF